MLKTVKTRRHLPEYFVCSNNSNLNVFAGDLSFKSGLTHQIRVILEDSFTIIVQGEGRGAERR